jgi:eukaryotic-like serine/threonine-protein kinase
MGMVYKARGTHRDRFVAIKVLPPEKVADAEHKRRFVQEAKSASALNHPNIIMCNALPHHPRAEKSLNPIR